jgi:hypothetical protein
LLEDYLERMITIARMVRNDVSRREIDQRGASLRERLAMLKSGSRIDAKQVNRIRSLIGVLVYLLGHKECTSAPGEDPPAD